MKYFETSLNVSGGIDAIAKYLELASYSGLPKSKTFKLVLERTDGYGHSNPTTMEVIKVQREDNRLRILQKGLLNTTVQAHPNGCSVEWCDNFYKLLL